MLCADGRDLQYAWRGQRQLAEQRRSLRNRPPAAVEVLRERPGEAAGPDDLLQQRQVEFSPLSVRTQPKSAAILRSVLRALDEQLCRPAARTGKMPKKSRNA